MGYRVEMRLVDSTLWLPCHSEPVCNTEFVVENLTPGSGYRFRVAAINRAGSGEPVELPQTVQLGEWLNGLVHKIVVILLKRQRLPHNLLYILYYSISRILILILNNHDTVFVTVCRRERGRA